MKVCFETFGCRLNRAEALQEEATYLARGWVRTERHDDADLIVVRGCSVTRRAQRDCERLIEHIRGKYPLKRVIVTGCLPDSDKNYKLNAVSRRIAAVGKDTDKPAVPTRTARAYLKVQDGCNGVCTFCIVPQFRGKATSVPYADCLARAQAFIDAGYREIVVTGCNLSMYADGGMGLPELLTGLASLDDCCRIRLGSLEPSPVALRTVETVAAHDNICNYLHIPVQCGSNRILAAMRRPYQTRLVEEIAKSAAKLMPGLGLGCDIMTGFPGETDTDFLATEALFRRIPFNKAHIFPYSERPGTTAVSLPSPVPQEIRSQRAHEIAELADDTRTRFAKSFKGKTVEIVVEDEKNLAGWTAEYLWCQVGAEKAKPLLHGRNAAAYARKQRVRILVRETHGHLLIGDVV